MFDPLCANIFGMGSKCSVIGHNCQEFNLNSPRIYCHVPLHPIHDSVWMVSILLVFDFIVVLWSGCFITWIEILTHDRVYPDTWTDCKPGYYLFYFGRHYSSMLLVLMSIEKCFAVYFPLKSKTVCTVRTAKWVTGVAGIILGGFNVQWLVVMEAAFDEWNDYICVENEYYYPTLDIIDTTFYSFGCFALMF